MYKCYLLLLWLLLLISCQNKASKPTSDAKWLGSEVVLPNGVVFSAPTDSLWKNNTLHIIMYIDSTECTPCSVDNIIMWNKSEYEKYMSKYKIDILLVFGTTQETVVRELMANYSISYPYAIDKRRNLLRANDFLSDKKFHTFIVDSNRKIIWLGSPIYSEKTWGLFTEMLDSSFI